MSYQSQNTGLIGDVAELVDALDLGSNVERRGGSSPFIPTIIIYLILGYSVMVTTGDSGSSNAGSNPTVPTNMALWRNW